LLLSQSFKSTQRESFCDKGTLVAAQDKKYRMAANICVTKSQYIVS
jgi:hypothetical protein